MRSLVLVASVLGGLLASGCGEACPAVPLAPLTESPRWIVRVNAWAPIEVEETFPGAETVVDPPGVGTYAAFSLYGASGAVLSDRWLDTSIGLEGTRARVDAATTVPTDTPPGQLRLLLAGAERPVLGFEVPSATLAARSAAWPSPPGAGGQLLDLITLGDGTAIANRREASDGAGGDLVVIERAAGGPVRTIDLDRLSSGGALPATIAPLGDGRLLAGLSLPDEPDAGAVATIEIGTGAAIRFDVPRLIGCSWVTSLSADASGPRAAVVCSGDPSLPPNERRGAGLALLGFEGSSPRVLATHLAGAIDPQRPPTGPIVPLAGDWVAVLSRGDRDSGRADALLAVHLTSGTVHRLFEERWTDVYGEALGSGDFAPDLGELWWPAATAGLLRWRMTGDDADATFTPLDAAPPQGCSRLPPRVVRAIGPTDDPGPQDAGVDAGVDPLVDAGPPAMDSGATSDAGADAGADAGVATLDAGFTP